MVRCIPTYTSLQTEGFAELFIREVFPHYGMPAKIVSDRGKQFNSEFMRELCRLSGIQQALTTSHHPSTNGLVERYNSVIEASLRSYVSADTRDWHTYLPFVEFALNSSFNAQLQSTPFRMNRISIPRNPLERRLESKRNLDTKNEHRHNLLTLPLQSSDLPRSVGITQLSINVSQFQADDRTVLQAAVEFENARKCVHAAKERMKALHDSRTGGPGYRYNIGDKVWLQNKFLSVRHPSLRGKLLPRFVGPFEALIVSKNGLAVTLDLPERVKVHPTFSISLVKHYHASDGHTPPPLIINDEEQYELEAIVDHNLIRGHTARSPKVVEFKVRWLGSYDESWHEFSDFTHSIESINRYIMTCNPSTRKQIFKALDTEEILLLDPILIKESGLCTG